MIEKLTQQKIYGLAESKGVGERKAVENKIIRKINEIIDIINSYEELNEK